jgi:small subunit ribosomal protein S2
VGHAAIGGDILERRSGVRLGRIIRPRRINRKKRQEMALPSFSMRQLLEAGVHFGHTTRRWNPRMSPYIFGVRNGVHIIDLEQTVPLLHQALKLVRDVVAGGGRVLFVGTKRQASEKIAESAKKCGQYYVNHRWLGGMLTNWKTISNSIKRLREVDERLVEENTGLTKKEILNLTRERDKLERALGGIKDMGGLPNVLFVVDTNKEHIAVAEARNLSIPVVAVLDSNSDPLGIDYPIPGNDDAIRAIGLYCELVADAVLDGIQEELTARGADVGEAEEAPKESLPEEPSGEETTPEEKAKETAETPAEAPAEAPAEEPAEVPAAESAPAESAPAEAAEGETVETPAETTEEKPVEAAGESAEGEPPAVEAKTEETSPEVAPEKPEEGQELEEAAAKPAAGGT